MTNLTPEERTKRLGFWMDLRDGVLCVVNVEGGVRPASIAEENLWIELHRREQEHQKEKNNTATDRMVLRAQREADVAAEIRKAKEEAWDACVDVAGNNFGLTGSAARALAMRNPHRSREDDHERA